MTDIRVFDNFYESLRWSSPGMLHVMHDDLTEVAIGGLTERRTPAYSAVVRLREQVLSLPTPMAKILDHILVVDLGYSLEHIEQVRQTNIALNRARSSRQIHGF